MQGASPGDEDSENQWLPLKELVCLVFRVEGVRVISMFSLVLVSASSRIQVRSTNKCILSPVGY